MHRSSHHALQRGQQAVLVTVGHHHNRELFSSFPVPTAAGQTRPPFPYPDSSLCYHAHLFFTCSPTFTRLLFPPHRPQLLADRSHPARTCGARLASTCLLATWPDHPALFGDVLRPALAASLLPVTADAAAVGVALGTAGHAPGGCGPLCSVACVCVCRCGCSLCTPLFRAPGLG